ncbi:MAG TPA: DUF4321 domain-containing protein [bacterium]|nr:DUF4321 domain-containing protein [bacterium]
MAKGAGAVLFFILIGGILGGYLGELLALLTPPGFFHDLFSKGVTIGFNDPLVLDLRILSFTFGVKLFINLTALAGMVWGYFRSK